MAKLEQQQKARKAQLEGQEAKWQEKCERELAAKQQEEEQAAADAKQQEAKPPPQEVKAADAPPPEQEQEQEDEAVTLPRPQAQNIQRSVQKQIQKILLQRIDFVPGTTKVMPKSLPVVDKIAVVLKANPQVTLVSIEGHVCSEDRSLQDGGMSSGRAKVVFDIMVSRGIKALRMTHQGFGSIRPVDGGCTYSSSEAQAQKQRRVEMYVRKCGGHTF